MKLGILFLAALFVCSAGAAAEEDERPDPSYSKDASLEAYLIVTDKGEELLTQWFEGAQHLRIQNIDTAKRGEFITVIVRFLGCEADESGMCSATVDYVAYRPDGAVYGAMRDRELWVNKPPPDPGASQLSADYMGLVIEATDPAGEYTVEAKVRDRVGDRTVTVSRRFEVSAPP